MPRGLNDDEKMTESRRAAVSCSGFLCGPVLRAHAEPPHRGPWAMAPLLSPLPKAGSG